MEWLVAISVAFISFIGNLSGNYLSHRKTTALIAYRLEQLEKEVREHNGFARKMPVIEEQIKVINHRLCDLEKGA